MSQGSVSIAKPYATAAFEYAHAQGELTAWVNFLEFASDLAGERTLQDYWRNPRVSVQQSAVMLIDLAQSALADSIRSYAENFIHLLAENHRLAVLPTVNMLFNKLCAAEKQLVNVDVISAQPLVESQQKTLQTKLQTKWQREVVLHCHVDETLLAGMVIRANDNVIDGSARGKLTRLMNHLVN